MEIYYKKNNNNEFFNNCENKELLDVENIQNYIPIYNEFFNLTKNNYNNINLNNLYTVHSLDSKISGNNGNKFKGILFNTLNQDTKNANIFFKFCPLLDPLKYITNKYDLSKNLLKLPQISDNNLQIKENDSDEIVSELCHAKMRDKNNAAYIDGFFTFLTSKLLHEHNFIHGVDFYGSFLAIKNNFLFNIYDDVDYLFNTEEFHRNHNVLFKLENSYHLDMLNYNTRNNKRRLIIDNNENDNNENDNNENDNNENDNNENDNNENDNNENDNNENDNNELRENGVKKENNSSNLVIELSDISDLNKIKTIFTSTPASDTNENIDKEDQELDKKSDLESNLIFEYTSNNKTKNTNSTTSTCSSRSSNTENSKDDDSDGNEGGSDEDNSKNESKESTNSTASDDEVFISINKFPIEIISLECCENTLDSYISESDINDNEWDSIILQILMILITYQKLFSMTHNDLHTNNIMYNKTDKMYLYYKINNRHYKVPTFGKIYKIIDYGRAIYKYKNCTMCSDSYHKEGDAATQYNFGAYVDENKQLIEPNYSFDLCRLSCSLFDFFVEDMEDLNKLKSSIKKIIISWCYDDKDRNILYKNNGDERYPDFKLYKMIARTVHNHLPFDVLQNKHFDKYHIAKKNISKNANIMNIDNYPTYI